MKPLKLQEAGFLQPKDTRDERKDEGMSMHKEFIKTLKLNQKLVFKKGRPEKEDDDQNSQVPRCLQIT